MQGCPTQSRETGPGSILGGHDPPSVSKGILDTNRFEISRSKLGLTRVSDIGQSQPCKAQGMFFHPHQKAERWKSASSSRMCGCCRDGAKDRRKPHRKPIP